ncbi:Crp/Fnr family transcriptional regulator [Flexithrix dorotheae]|uniref:Crp/Fnr family transcriptional regulator n=1 Tax=Flexithrix dorotheae TaxID=70993 RepID=UPI00036532AC|nr:Crp/Fnr family transcriptional regulator [Flexithrix dorotheae]
MNPQLTEHIKQFASPTEEDLALLFEEVEYKAVGPKEFLLKEGQFCKFQYFVLKGCLRLYQINDRGNEQIFNFGIPNWWITDLDSLINHTPAKKYIQATKKCEVLKFSRVHLEKVMAVSPAICNYFRILLEKVKVADQRKMEYSLKFSGEELYHHFCSKNPAFVQEVPQYMIASYLGFTPEFISKIRGKK